MSYKVESEIPPESDPEAMIHKDASVAVVLDEIATTVVSIVNDQGTQNVVTTLLRGHHNQSHMHHEMVVVQPPDEAISFAQGILANAILAGGPAVLPQFIQVLKDLKQFMVDLRNGTVSDG